MIRSLARGAYRLLHPYGARVRINELDLRLPASIARGVPRRIDTDALAPWLAAATGAHAVIDAGANVGIWSALAARVLCPGGRVHAFEPSPASYQVLAELARVAYGPGTIVPIHSALGDHDGITHITLDGETAATNRLADEGLEVPLVTIDTYCARNGIAPSAIKVDVEGAEVLLLAGAERVLREHRPIVILELHWRAALGATPAHLMRTLNTVGYDAYSISSGTVMSGEDTLLRQNAVILRPRH
jgi:FkbM family methyltransferase